MFSAVCFNREATLSAPHLNSFCFVTILSTVEFGTEVVAFAADFLNIFVSFPKVPRLRAARPSIVAAAIAPIPSISLLLFFLGVGANESDLGN